MTMGERIYLFDTTLRDGAQTQGVDFSVADKTAIARELDQLGIDYVEGGWPGANPTDDAFFADPPELRNSTFTAFGMTRHVPFAPDPVAARLLAREGLAELATEAFEMAARPGAPPQLLKAAESLKQVWNILGPRQAS